MIKDNIKDNRLKKYIIIQKLAKDESFVEK